MVPRLATSTRPVIAGLVLFIFALMTSVLPSLQVEVLTPKGRQAVDQAKLVHDQMSDSETGATWSTSANLDGASAGMAIANELSVVAPGARGGMMVSTQRSPAARQGVAIVELADGTVLAIGGFDSEIGFRARVDAYDPHSKRWRQVASMPTPRHGHRATLAADGRVYVAGGYFFDVRQHYLDLTSVYLPELLAYDPVANTWASVGEVATPRFDPEVTAGEDGMIYIRGGLTPSGKRPTNDEAFDIGHNTWFVLASASTP